MREDTRADSKPSWPNLYLDKFPTIKDSPKLRAKDATLLYPDYMFRPFGNPVAICSLLLRFVGSCCISLHSTTNTDATTSNILGPTILGVVASVCT